MNLKHLGTQYGGWTIDIDRVPEEGVVIDAGVGTDMSFAEELHKLRPKLKFVLVDHTEDSLEFVTKKMNRPWVEFVHAAVAPLGVKSLVMYKHKSPSGGSESMSSGHRFADTGRPYTVPAVSLTDLIVKHRPVLVKLDIESAEYATIRECIGVAQVCCEFHHRMDTKYTAKDTEDVLTDFRRAGYDVADRTETDEILLVRKK